MISEQIYAVLNGLLPGQVYKRVIEQDAEYPCAVYYYVAVSEEPFVDAGQLIARYRVGVNLYAKESDQVDALFMQVVTALRAMPEFIEQNIAVDGYEPDTATHTWTLDFTFRDVSPQT